MTLSQRRKFAAGGFTVLLWSVMFLLSLFISPSQKNYKTVEIRLESSKPSPIKESLAKTVTENSAEKQTVQKTAQDIQKNETAPVKPIPAKPAPAKQTQTNSSQKTLPPAQKKEPSQKSAPAKQQLQKSVEELMNEQLAKKTSPKKEINFDEIDWEESTSSKEQTSSKTTSSSPFNALEGTAGTAETSGKNSTSLSSSSDRENAVQNVSENTRNALNEILNAEFSSQSQSNVSTVASLPSQGLKKSSSSNISMVMDNLSVRELLEPSEPAITLSPAAAATVDSSKNLSIKFVVSSQGIVKKTTIEISPKSAVSVIVQNEIAAAVSKWRFSSDTTDAAATFTYKIVKN